MKKHSNMYACNGTSYYGDHIITTAQRLIDLFGQPTFEGVSCDGGQLEWVLEHNGNCITIYDRRRSPYGLNDQVGWNIGAHNATASMDAETALRRLVYGENFENLWNNLKNTLAK